MVSGRYNFHIDLVKKVFLKKKKTFFLSHSQIMEKICFLRLSHFNTLEILIIKYFVNLV